MLGLPACELGVRGRMGLRDAGRFSFEAPLRWTKAGELVVEVTGNMMNSGTEDSPETWFHYRVVVDPRTAQVSKVVELKRGRTLL